MTTLPDDLEDFIDCSGQWVAALDTEDQGLAEQWWRRWEDGGLAAHLPGTTETNGFGVLTSVGSCHHFTRKRPYSGAAWWWRAVQIPEHWAGRRIELQLERCLWTSRAWLGGELLGQRDSLTTPHVFRCPDDPGRKLLAIRTDNRCTPAHMGRFDETIGFDPRSNVAHSVTDHTQTLWNGIIGRIRLRALPLVHIRHPRVSLGSDLRHISVAIRIGNDAGQRGPAQLTVDLAGVLQRVSITLNGAPVQEVTLGVQRPDHLGLWDDLNPNLHRLCCRLSAGDAEHEVVDRIGLRHLAVDDGSLRINGRQLHLRGTLEYAIWPQTGHPPTSRPEWDRVMTTLRAHGLNHLRFHSWCPPEAAFLAAVLCHETRCDPTDLQNRDDALAEIQRRLLRMGQHIPGMDLSEKEDLVRRAAVTASSSIALQALPDDGPGLPLESGLAQMVPGLEGSIPGFSCSVDVSEATRLRVELRCSSDRADEHSPDRLLQSWTVALQPGSDQVVGPFTPDMGLGDERYLFWCLLPEADNEGVGVMVHGSRQRLTGLLSLSRRSSLSQERFGGEDVTFWLPQRRPKGHNLAFALTAPVTVMEPDRIQRGAARSTSGPQAWVADPSDPAQEIRLSWPTPSTVARIELALDVDYDHPMESAQWDHHDRVVPFVICDLHVRDSSGQLLATVTDNRHGLLVIALPKAVETDGLTIEVVRTGGDPPATGLQFRLMNDCPRESPRSSARVSAFLGETAVLTPVQSACQPGTVSGLPRQPQERIKAQTRSAMRS